MQHHSQTSRDASNAKYDAHLTTRDLIDELRGLFATQRRAEWLICRYLADLADRVRARQDAELWAYVDELHAARCFFQLGVRETRERVRVGRALRKLPEIEQALVAGTLSYSRVREVTRVATSETENEWLALATQLDMRGLERRVASASYDAEAQADTGSARTAPAFDEGPRVEWTTPGSVRVTFNLSADAWALLERAIEVARHLAADTLSDSEALEAVARDAIAHQNDETDASDPRTSVVLYTCKECTTSELHTGSGALQLDAASAAAFSCGATTLDLEHAGRSVTFGSSLPAAVRRAVLLRDRCRCRVPGCRRRRYVDVHHIEAQADGGAHSRGNCVTLCTTHHRLLHEGKLAITGDADGALDVGDSLGAMIGDGATQGGSSPAECLLRVMGHRGGWSTDELVETSGLPAGTVSSTLLMLELEGRVRAKEMVFERSQ